MEQRIDYYSLTPDALKSMQNIEEYIGDSDLDSLLIELVKLRTSQINGYA